MMRTVFRPCCASHVIGIVVLLVIGENSLKYVLRTEQRGQEET